MFLSEPGAERSRWNEAGGQNGTALAAEPQLTAHPIRLKVKKKKLSQSFMYKQTA